MSTTALAVELLVIGYQALIWIVLLALLFPINDNISFQWLKEWKELLVIGSVVAAYTAGAIINGITSRIMEMTKIESKIYKREIVPSKMRAAILTGKPEAFAHIMNNFDAPRVLRSTILNLLLISIFTAVHLSLSQTLSSFQWILFFLISIGCIIATAWAWYETAENFYIHLTATYDEIIKGLDTKRDP